MMSLALSLGRCFSSYLDVASDPSARFYSTASHMVEGFTDQNAYTTQPPNPNFEPLSPQLEENNTIFEILREFSVFY
jgi:hypothetical protein